MFYIDWLYIILILPVYIFTLITSSKVNSTFKKYDNVPANNLTGEQVARKILDANGLFDVKIEQVKGELSDHYDPKSKVIRLSNSTYSKSSCSAIGVAAHEVGHAIQHAQGYAPLKIRNTIIPITNIGARLSTPLIIIGIILSVFGSVYAYIAYAGVALFGLTAVFQLVTLPVEYNASKRAMQNLEQLAILDAEQQIYAKKVLDSAALTYVAALSVSLSQLLYLFLIVARNTRQD